MAGIAMWSGYGAYRGEPPASLKNSGWIPNSQAASRAEALMAAYPANAAAIARRGDASVLLPATAR